MCSKYIRKRRANLWTKDPHCFWCGKLTVNDGENSSDSATIDHIRSKLHPLRKEPIYGSQIRLVLACKDCNNARAYYENQTLGIPELRARAERYGQKFDFNFVPQVEKCPLVKSYSCGTVQF
jgi:5-methylcytosine-specific restriction endonuclease McrA